MSYRCVFALALCAVFLAGAADANYIHHVYKSYTDKSCRAPREGQWEIVHRFQASHFDAAKLPPGNEGDDLVVTLIATVTLTSSVENVYNGTGYAEEFVPQEANNVPVQIMAFFDPQSCVLSGTVFAYPDSRAATFRWKVLTETKMEGRFMPTINGISGKILSGIQSATFLG